MSKLDKTHKISTNTQLRRDLNQAGKVLKELTSTVEKIEASLLESEAFLAAENKWKDENLKLQIQVAGLQEENRKCRNEQHKEVEAFATCTLKLGEDFRARLRKRSQEFAASLEEAKRREAGQEQKWQRNSQSMNRELKQLRENDDNHKRQVEEKYKRAEELWHTKETALYKKIQEVEHSLLTASGKTQELLEDLEQHRVMLKGRETELSRIADKFRLLEAFCFKPQDEIKPIMNGLEQRVENFCSQCVDCAETVPGWNQFSEGLHQAGLPLMVSMDSNAGRHVFRVAIQHVLCVNMMENVFTCPGNMQFQQAGGIIGLIDQRNPSHAAIWRLMTADAILTCPKMLEKSKDHLRSIAGGLLKSWKLFQTKSVQDQFLNLLTDLLFQSYTTWLELMKLQERVFVDMALKPSSFDSDSAEQLPAVPGGFTETDSTAGFCLFPTTFRKSGTGTRRSILVRKGHLMLPTSSALLAALKEEEQIRSPKSNQKRTSKFPVD